MAKEKDKPATTWAQKMKEFGGGDFTFLSSDGETLTFIVVGLPHLLKSHFKGKEQDRIGCPIVSEDGYQLFICGKRLARKISKREKVFETNALMVVRHGIEGDVNARYDLRVLPETETYERLMRIKGEDFKLEMIAESVKAAQQVMEA